MLFVRFGLVPDVTLPVFVIPAKNTGSDFRTETAVDAGVVIVEGSGNIPEEAVGKVGHAANKAGSLVEKIESLE
jgi:hypothetical protein